MAVASPLYIAFVDRRQADPEDAYAVLGQLILTGKRPADWRILSRHARGWIIKGFFLPLMFCYLSGDLNGWWQRIGTLQMDSFSNVYDRLFELFFAFDVLFGTIGYLFTLRLLDTHIRSAEPTLFGWVICIMCYEPFWNMFSRYYIAYETDKFYWGGWLDGHHALYVAWGSVILFLTFVFAWATVSFGLRFSNLTNRGIITNGPYRWLKHPAYVAKNLSWWLISVPLMSNAGWQAALRQTALLLLLNAVYALRAYTEERHLSADPDYRAYSAFIREHGLVAMARRAFAHSARPRDPT